MLSRHLDFEVSPSRLHKGDSMLSYDNINEKYAKGYSRVITEIGTFKISIIPETFSKVNYDLQPSYQRRIIWNAKKRSKLIESLIINIPIPPIFLYEYDYDKYEIMDGLQRITSIVDFYHDEFKLTGLEEWSELNGKTYSKLPEKIREGIDRRQIQVITLLKESAKSDERADKIRRLVFERLNTGGEKLQGQEIRNAIYSGKGNNLCIELSKNPVFKKLWNIPLSFEDIKEMDSFDYQKIEDISDIKLRKKIEKHSLYKRMLDVELVLRFFAMRYVEEFNYALAEFLDNTLIQMNKYSESELAELRVIFENSINKAYGLFGTHALKFYDGKKWTSPSRMIYDPLMLALSQVDISSSSSVEENVSKLMAFYIENSSTSEDDQENSLFDGKHQSKDDIIRRTNKFIELIQSL